jgi:DinB superfamily
MGETPQQYSQRIMKMIEGRDPLKTQSATPKKLESLLKRAPASRVRKRPTPDKWSVAEILAHLADTEIVVGWRIRSILGAPGTAIQAFDQDAWAAAGNYAKRDPRKSIDQSRALQITQSRTMEAFRHARGARRRKSPANPAHDGRARHQSRFADRTHSRAQEIKSLTRRTGAAPLFTRRRGLATTPASQIRPVFLHRGCCTNSSRLEGRRVHSRP